MTLNTENPTNVKGNPVSQRIRNVLLSTIAKIKLQKAKISIPDVLDD